MTAMSAEHSEKLIRMARQIADFFKAYPEETAVEGVREHIAKFWTARMREDISGLAKGGAQAGLDPLVVKALARLGPKKA